jgi:hypothetical protein
MSDQKNPQGEVSILSGLTTLPKEVQAKIRVFESVPPQELLAEALKETQSHFLQSENPYFATDIKSAVMMEAGHVDFTKYPLSTILRPGADHKEAEGELQIYRRLVSRASQKADVRKDLEAEFKNLGLSSTISTDALSIVDELFTNAVYNAPFVDMEYNLRTVPEGTDELRLPPGRAAAITLGADDQRLVLGCYDDFGTLNVNKFLTRIKNCYETGVAATMRMDSKGGAGIGAYMVFSLVASFFVHVERGRHTAVFCVLPRKMSHRARSEMPKNLHVIFRK